MSSSKRMEAVDDAAAVVEVALRSRITAAAFRGLAPLAPALFVLWMILDGQTSLVYMALGAILACFVAGLSHFLLQDRLSPSLQLAMVVRLPLFGVVLFQQIILANWDILKRTFSPRLPISPRIASFESFLSSDLARAALANCITLTPGTVTVEVDGPRFHVHCLAREHEEALLDGRMERLVAWVFADGPAESRSPW